MSKETPQQQRARVRRQAKHRTDTLRDFVEALNALGFNDEHADINGADVVDLVNEFYDDLVLSVRS